MKADVSTLVMFAMIVTVACQQPSSSRSQNVGSSGYSTSVPARGGESRTQSQVTSQRGDLPPGPDLSPEERERLIQGTERQQNEGSVTQEQVAPQRGDLPPGPDLSPEERERLIHGTEREKPSSTATPKRDQ